MGRGEKLPERPVPTSSPGLVNPCGDIEIVDEKGQVLTATQTKMVGQRVSLRVRSKPAGAPLSGVQWEVEPGAVKSYVRTLEYRKPPEDPVTEGTVTLLSAADLRMEEISFYWALGEPTGMSVGVSVTATVKGLVKTKRVSFRVLRPKVDRFTMVKSDVSVCIRTFNERSASYLTAHVLPGTPGNKWYAQVTAPPGGDGRIAFTQLIDRDATRACDDGTVEHKSRGGEFALDHTAGIEYCGSQPIEGGQPANLDHDKYSDSPGITLEPFMTSAECRDRFQLYLMYKPDGPDNIWVTLGMGTWSWKGKTTRAGTAAPWSEPTDKDLQVSDGVDAVRLPRWSKGAPVAWKP